MGPVEPNMASSNIVFESSTSDSSSSNRPRPTWQYELFDNHTIDAFARISRALSCGFAFFTTKPPAWLHADLTTVYTATTANEARIKHLAQKQEDLKQESKLELEMKKTLHAEVKRLEECLAIHQREISNIAVREEIRQFQLAELKDLGLVMLVRALRDETPEDEGVEKSCGDKMPKRQTSGSQDRES